MATNCPDVLLSFLSRLRLHRPSLYCCCLPAVLTHPVDPGEEDRRICIAAPVQLLECFVVHVCALRHNVCMGSWAVWHAFLAFGSWQQQPGKNQRQKLLRVIRDVSLLPRLPPHHMPASRFLWMPARALLGGSFGDLSSRHVAVSPLFLLVVACNIVCIMTESISLGLSLMICIRTVLSGSLFTAACHGGCDAGRCTHVLTDPASLHFKVKAIIHDLHSWALVIVFGMHSRYPVVECTFPGILHRHQRLHVVFVDEMSEAFSRAIRGFGSAAVVFLLPRKARC